MVISENTRLGYDFPPPSQNAPGIDILNASILPEIYVGPISPCKHRMIDDEPFENEEELTCLGISIPWTEEEILNSRIQSNSSETTTKL